MTINAGHHLPLYAILPIKCVDQTWRQVLLPGSRQDPRMPASLTRRPLTTSAKDTKHQ